MSLIGKVVKSFNFVLEIDGAPKFSMQKVTLPEIEIEETLHSAGSYEEKTPGRLKVSDLVCEKFMAYGDPTENWAWEWLLQVQNYELGNLVPANTAKNARLIAYQDDALTIAKIYELGKIWPKKIATGDFDKTSSDNVMETVTFSVTKFKKII